MLHGESCYYVASTSSASTWTNSRRFCQDLGADLAVIKSEDENQFVYDLLRNTSRAHDGWIGLYRRKTDKKFYWLDGRTAEGNFQKWNDGELSNGATEDFGRILGDSNEEKKKGNWNDTPRSSTMTLAICQWPI
ncbi:C-type lectin domain family 4 member E-like [Acropora muricata]|uniref:C-type lectin domain family 4 member E-like n=1 Tax=Acropora muricata TaxID=159855 RepID=UPI0034E515B1